MGECIMVENSSIRPGKGYHDYLYFCKERGLEINNKKQKIVNIINTSIGLQYSILKKIASELEHGTLHECDTNSLSLIMNLSIHNIEKIHIATMSILNGAMFTSMGISRTIFESVMKQYYLALNNSYNNYKKIKNTRAPNIKKCLYDGKRLDELNKFYNRLSAQVHSDPQWLTHDNSIELASIMFNNLYLLSLQSLMAMMEALSRQEIHEMADVDNAIKNMLLDVNNVQKIEYTLFPNKSGIILNWSESKIKEILKEI